MAGRHEEDERVKIAETEEASAWENWESAAQPGHIKRHAPDWPGGSLSHFKTTTELFHKLD